MDTVKHAWNISDDRAKEISIVIRTNKKKILTNLKQNFVCLVFFYPRIFFFILNQDCVRDIYLNTSRPNVFVSQRFAQMNDVANLSIIRQKGITFFLFPYASHNSCISSLSSLKSMLRETCFAGANHASSFAFWFMIKTVAVNFNPIH